MLQFEFISKNIIILKVISCTVFVITFFLYILSYGLLIYLPDLIVLYMTQFTFYITVMKVTSSEENYLLR